MTSDEQLLAEADALYGLPLGDFTPQRDLRARDLRTDDRELSAAVKALRKPTLAAWVINLLVRREAEQVDQVITLGAALRDAQASLEGEQLRELTRQRRQLTAAVTTQARRLASAEGVKVTPAVADQVEASLTAAMIDGEAARALRSGLLIAPMATTGVDDLDLASHVAVPTAMGFVATPQVEDSAPDPTGPPHLRVVPDPDADAKRLAAARAELDEAEAVVDVATAELTDAQQATTRHEATSLQIQAEIEELQRQLGELEERQEIVDGELAEAHEAVEAAEAEVARADAERARLADRVRRLES